MSGQAVTNQNNKASSNSIFTIAATAIASFGAGYLLNRFISGGKQSKSKTTGFTKASSKDNALSNNSSDVATIINELTTVFPTFVDTFLSMISKHHEMDNNAINQLKRMIEYNCLGGKYYRGYLAVSTAQEVCSKLNIQFTGQLKQAAQAIAWAVEVMQAEFLVADDIMDSSLTRRGRPCWYMLPDVKMNAVNDALILNSFAAFLIRQYVPGTGSNTDDQISDAFPNIDALFDEVRLQTQLGQMLDLNVLPQGRKDLADLNRFSLDLYMKIVKYKTAFYTFYLPIASSLLLVGENSEQQMNVCRSICVNLGTMFQIQDDYLDCYGGIETGELNNCMHNCFV
jgi:geranylgeranyl pyrophosphate synthase